MTCCRRSGDSERDCERIAIGSCGFVLSVIYAFTGFFIIMRFWVMQQFYVYGIFLITMLPMALLMLILTQLIIFDDSPRIKSLIMVVLGVLLGLFWNVFALCYSLMEDNEFIRSLNSARYVNTSIANSLDGDRTEAEDQFQNSTAPSFYQLDMEDHYFFDDYLLQLAILIFFIVFQVFYLFWTLIYLIRVSHKNRTHEYIVKDQDEDEISEWENPELMFSIHRARLATISETDEIEVSIKNLS